MNICEINIIRIGQTKRAIYEDRNTRYVAEYSCKIKDSEIRQDVLNNIMQKRIADGGIIQWK